MMLCRKCILKVLDDAMQRLGLEKVKRIALNTSVLTLFNGNQFTNHFSPDTLWTHSVGVAVASASLADFLRFPMSDQAYSCGLIHDIGKLAKLKYDQQNFCEELNKANELGLSNFFFKEFRFWRKKFSLDTVTVTFGQYRN